MLNPTPSESLLGASGRPYFLWDTNLTLEEFHARLNSDDQEVRSYFIAKLMRQAKPDDVLTFLTPAQVETAFPSVTKHLGQSRPFWSWLLAKWRELGVLPAEHA